MTHTIECIECDGSGIITSRFQMRAYVGPQTMDPPEYDQFNCEYCDGNGVREVESDEVQSWRIANDLRIANNKAAADAAYKKLLADNPGFAAIIPQLEELAGIYAAAVDA